MVKKDYKELDEAIRGKVVQFLYNQGDGKKVPIAHLACLRNRDRSKSKQVRICTYEPCMYYLCSKIHNSTAALRTKLFYISHAVQSADTFGSA